MLYIENHEEIDCYEEVMRVLLRSEDILGFRYVGISISLYLNDDVASSFIHFST